MRMMVSYKSFAFNDLLSVSKFQGFIKCIFSNLDFLHQYPTTKNQPKLKKVNNQSKPLDQQNLDDCTSPLEERQEELKGKN